MNRSRRIVRYTFAAIVTATAAVGVLSGASPASAAPGASLELPTAVVAAAQQGPAQAAAACSTDVLPQTEGVTWINQDNCGTALAACAATFSASDLETYAYIQFAVTPDGAALRVVACSPLY